MSLISLCSHQVLVWLSLGEKEWLAGPILDQLIDMLVRCQPYEELSDIDSKTKKHYRRAFATPLAVCRNTIHCIMMLNYLLHLQVSVVVVFAIPQTDVLIIHLLLFNWCQLIKRYHITTHFTMLHDF